MTESVLDPNLDKLSIKEQRIFKDFYWTFRHSQGTPQLQTLISLYVVKKYNPNDVPSIERLENMGKELKSLRVPTQHTDKVTSKEGGEKVLLDQQQALTSESGFEISWGRYVHVINRVLNGAPNPRDMLWLGGSIGEIYESSNLSENQLLAKILKTICYEDNDYQSKGRPQRKEGSDIHESFLREYSFEARPGETVHYTALYKDLRKLLDDLGIGQIKNGVYPSSKLLLEKASLLGLSDEEVTPLMSDFTNLIQNWEKNHPGQKFLEQKS